MQRHRDQQQREPRDDDPGAERTEGADDPRVGGRHLDEQQQQQCERRLLDEIGVHADGGLRIWIAKATSTWRLGEPSSKIEISRRAARLLGQRHRQVTDAGGPFHRSDVRAR